jgi:pyruvate/2-oxoglutarate dehydrogenase complex dihydrolipoamide acyltransferase (E2) component
MNKKIRPYHVVDLTPGRRVWLNTLDLSWTPHAIYGLLEVDVTAARQFIAEHKARTGESLSFTGYLTFCLARAVDEDKTVQAHLKGRKQIVIFDDVDVALMVEGKVGEKRR